MPANENLCIPEPEKKKWRLGFLEPHRCAVPRRLQRECPEISRHLPHSCSRKRQGTARSTRIACWCSLRRPLHSVFTDGRISGGPVQQTCRDHLDESVLKWGVMLFATAALVGTQSEIGAGGDLSRVHAGSALRAVQVRFCCRSCFRRKGFRGATASSNSGLSLPLSLGA